MRHRAAWLAAAALVAAGCSPKARPPEALVFWLTEPPAAVAPVVARFEAANPGVRVKLETVPADSLPARVAAALAGGEPPDLCEMPGGLMRGLLGTGALSDWSAGVADQRDSLVGWEACRVGDALYGMPWHVSPRRLFWNAELFARAGLDPAKAPPTWDALLAAAARVQRLGRGVRGYGLADGDSAAVVAEFLSYAWANGGAVLGPAADSACFDSAPNVETLAFLLKLRHAGSRDSLPALDAAFANGRLGLRLADAGYGARLAREAPGLRFGAGPVPVPATAKGPDAPYGEVTLLASFARSRHKEHALRLARALVRPEDAVEAFARAGGAPPANAGADTLEWFRAHPHEAALAAEAGRARFARAHPAWAEMTGAIAGQIGRAMRGEATAAEAVAEAGSRVAQLAGRR